MACHETGGCPPPAVAARIAVICPAHKMGAATTAAAVKSGTLTEAETVAVQPDWSRTVIVKLPFCPVLKLGEA